MTIIHIPNQCSMDKWVAAGFIDLGLATFAWWQQPVYSDSHNGVYDAERLEYMQEDYQYRLDQGCLRHNSTNWGCSSSTRSQRAVAAHHICDVEVRGPQPNKYGVGARLYARLYYINWYILLVWTICNFNSCTSHINMYIPTIEILVENKLWDSLYGFFSGRNYIVIKGITLANPTCISPYYSIPPTRGNRQLWLSDK